MRLCHKRQRCQLPHNSDKLEIMAAKLSWLEFAHSCEHFLKYDLQISTPTLLWKAK